MTRAEMIAKKVSGFLVPEFTELLPDGSTLNGLTKEGFDMVIAGYACGQCLATFKEFTLQCPICRQMHTTFAPDPPQMWLDYLAERNAPVPVEKPEVVNPFAIGQPLDKNEIETIPISKLRDSRKRRGK
jgi:hypothetical protein